MWNIKDLDGADMAVFEWQREDGDPFQLPVYLQGLQPTRQSQRGLYSEDLELRTDGTQIRPIFPSSFYARIVVCSGCSREVKTHFHCNICENGDFDLCQRCVKQGLRCSIAQHWLIRRNISYHQIIEAPNGHVRPEDGDDMRIMKNNASCEYPDLYIPFELDELHHAQLPDNDPDYGWKRAAIGEVKANMTAAASALFQHQALRHAGSQLRLLKFSSNSTNSSLAFDLTVHDIDMIPSYIAVSYTWGPRTQSHLIWINTQPMIVDRNCWYVLWQMQNHHRSKSIWIDAICIDQENLPEKGLQVQNMGSIYSKSDAVVVGLGPHDCGSAILLRALEDNKSVSQYVRWKDIEHMPSWVSKAMFMFGCRRYWSRLWIIQELEKAPRLEFLCGPDIYPESISALSKIISVSSVTDEFAAQLGMRPVPWEHTPMFRALKGRQLARVLSRSGQPLKEFNRTLNQTGSAKCSDPRDSIFGIMSLVRWNSEHPMKADYSMSKLALANLAAKSLQGSHPRARGKVCHSADVLSLCDALSLTQDDTEIKGLLDERQGINCDEVDVDPRKSESQQLIGFEYQRIYRLVKHPDSPHLRAERWDRNADVTVSELGQQKLQSGLQTSAVDRFSIQFEEGFTARAPPVAHPGDILLVCGGAGMIGTHAVCGFVLRKPSKSADDCEALNYDIICQVIVPNEAAVIFGPRIPNFLTMDEKITLSTVREHLMHSIVPQPGMLPDVWFVFDQNDLFAWMCQDYDKSNIGGWLHSESRLSTRVSAFPRSSYARMPGELFAKH